MASNTEFVSQMIVRPLLNGCSSFIIAVSALMAPTLAMAAPVTYGFDYEITFDHYRNGWTGPLLAKGSKGSGTVVLEYQHMAEGNNGFPGWNTWYTARPFSVVLGTGTDALVLIDSTKGNTIYGQRGILVQDVPSTSLVYDSISIEGFSGPVNTVDANGRPVEANLHSRLGFFSPSNIISNYDLSEANIDKISKNLIHDSFEVWNISAGGTVAGKISNFHKLDDIHAVPEPSSAALMGLVIAGLAFSRRRKA